MASRLQGWLLSTHYSSSPLHLQFLLPSQCSNCPASLSVHTCTLSWLLLQAGHMAGGPRWRQTHPYVSTVRPYGMELGRSMDIFCLLHCAAQKAGWPLCVYCPPAPYNRSQISGLLSLPVTRSNGRGPVSKCLTPTILCCMKVGRALCVLCLPALCS